MSGQGYHFAIGPDQVDALLAAGDDRAVLDFTDGLVDGFVPGEVGCGGDKAWDVLHRCLGDGTFDPGGGTPPLNRPFLGGRLLVREGSIVNLVTADQVRETAAALAGLDTEWLRRRLAALYRAEFDGAVPEDFAGRLQALFEELRDFYRQAAADGKAVVFVTDDGLEIFRHLREREPHLTADPGRTGRHVAWLKRGLLLFWAAYLSVVFATNLSDGLKAAGVLSPGWAFASGNYAFLCEVTARYGTPAGVNAVLFGGVVAWEGLAATLFWLAGVRFRRGSGLVYAASGCGLGLWAAFILADEVFVTYAVEATHWRLFVAQLATLLAVELLPEDASRR